MHNLRTSLSSFIFFTLLFLFYMHSVREPRQEQVLLCSCTWSYGFIQDCSSLYELRGQQWPPHPTLCQTRWRWNNKAPSHLERSWAIRMRMKLSWHALDESLPLPLREECLEPPGRKLISLKGKPPPAPAPLRFCSDCPGVTLNTFALDELTFLSWVNEAAPRDAPPVSATFPATFSSWINSTSLWISAADQLRWLLGVSIEW